MDPSKFLIIMFCTCQFVKLVSYYINNHEQQHFLTQLYNNGTYQYIETAYKIDIPQ